MKSLFVLFVSLLTSTSFATPISTSCEIKLRAQASRLAEQIATDVNLVSYVTGFQDALAVTLIRGLNTYASWKVTRLKLDQNNHYVDSRRAKQAGPQSEFTNGLSLGVGESFVLEQGNERVFLNSSKISGTVSSAEIIWVQNAKSRRPVRHYLTISSDLFGSGVYAAGSGARSVEALLAFMEQTRHHDAKDVSALILKWAELEID